MKTYLSPTVNVHYLDTNENFMDATSTEDATGGYITGGSDLDIDNTGTNQEAGVRGQKDMDYDWH